MSHEDFQGLAAGYGLHALEPDEEQRLITHLPGCVSCSQLVADTTSISAALTEMLEPAPPPADLRVRILAAAAAEQNRPATDVEPAATTSRVDRAVVQPDRSTQLPRPKNVTRAAGGWQRTGRLLHSRVAIGVLAALIGVGVAIPATLAAADHTTTSASSTLAQWLLNPQAREISMRGPAKGALAKAIMTDDGVYLIASGLTPNNRTKSTYVMWVVNKQGEPTPVVTFDVRNATAPELTFATLPLNRTEISHLVVSYEPGRKAPSKPSNIELSGSPA